ncbi:DUF58 domain-containing protein [Undibacterium sp. CY7W]|uniref:DUF58 domain-containing protein n=1 Tax=Undibacterium rugosum TaxID=2762291 RepID=A0A923I0V9_9BURK|nr:DUF58 domain-containing protein [Undibacterium rugosum]MBC3935744.1 DUF58 domain-containing protein [Undibacterium rugosum]
MANNAIRSYLRRVIFLEKQPEPGTVILKQRRVYTLPSRPGWMMLLVLLLLFVTATNYSLSLGFALTFMLAAVMVVNALLGFRNLAYLELQAGSPDPVFVGEEIRFPLYLNNPRRNSRYAIWVGWQAKDQISKACDIAPQSQLSVFLHAPSVQRGWQPATRISIQTWFPLGLLRAWSTWLPDVQALVYPAPELQPPPLPVDGVASSANAGQYGDEDFAGVRTYQPGDPLRQLAWKQIARVDTAAGGQLVSKLFAGQSGADVVIDFTRLPRRLDTELKLARMCSWVLQAERQGLPYAFRLDTLNLAPALGAQHRDACLRALALYPLEATS